MLRLALATHTPEVATPPPVALLTGSFAERLDKASRLGVDGLELMCARPAGLDAAALRGELAARGLQAAAIASGPVFMQDGLTLMAASADVAAQAAQRLDDLVDLAAALGAGIVTIGSFRGRAAWAPVPGARQRLAECLALAAQRAAARGVRLALEPLNRYETDLVRSAAEGLELIEEAGAPGLGLLLDTFHMNIEEADYAAALRLAHSAGKLFHVHLGDSNRLPPGRGHFDFAGLVKTLETLGYEGYLSAELLPLPDADVAAAQTVAYMRQWMRAK
jgi:sugar phosphate isomerase/epimerase